MNELETVLSLEDSDFKAFEGKTVIVYGEYFLKVNLQSNSSTKYIMDGDVMIPFTDPSGIIPESIIFSENMCLIARFDSSVLGKLEVLEVTIDGVMYWK